MDVLEYQMDVPAHLIILLSSSHLRVLPKNIEWMLLIKSIGYLLPSTLQAIRKYMPNISLAFLKGVFLIGTSIGNLYSH